MRLASTFFYGEYYKETSVQNVITKLEFSAGLVKIINGFRVVWEGYS